VLAGVTAAVTAPVTALGASALGFLVADSTGPAVTGHFPADQAVDVAPSEHITITFSENIQAGAGTISIDNPSIDPVNYANTTVINYDVTDSTYVSIVANTMTLIPKFYFRPGPVTVTMASGVVTDDPHFGTSNPMPSPGLTGGGFVFNVADINRVVPPNKLQLGGGSAGARSCSYVLESYNCPHFEECVVEVRPMGDMNHCRDGGPDGSLVRKISYDSQMKIAQHGFERNGGDGRGTVLSYGNGVAWPEKGVADLE